METRSAKRKKLLHQKAQAAAASSTPNNPVQIQDRISDLPDDILHQILSFLPIQSVARTGVVSRRWRNVWHSFPNLDFTNGANAIANTMSPFVRKPKMSGMERSCFHRVSDYVDQIIGLLEKHSGVLSVLKIRFVTSFSGLNSLIRGAVRHHVQELDVEVSTFDYFNFPRCVLNCETLRVFRLKSFYPGFRLPPVEIMKQGFRALCTLSLSGPFLRDQPSVLDLFTDSSFPSLKNLNLDACSGLKNLRIKCPCLEDLSIDGCHHMQYLEISVRKLQRLRVTRSFAHTSVTRVKIDAPMLASILWSGNIVTDESVLRNLTSLRKARVEFFIRQGYQNPEKIKSALNFLSGISHCHQYLTLDSQCIDVLSRTNRFAGNSFSPFHKLGSLELFMAGFHKQNIPGMAKIVKNSPNIHTFIITIRGPRYPEERLRNVDDLSETWSFEEEMKYWESQTQCFESLAHRLKAVKIYGFVEYALELSFVKFMLKHGKVLRQVFLHNSSVSSKQMPMLVRENFRSQILCFSKASPNVSIVFQ
ncbi:putative F-box/FBD/LRR-repeat protein At4g03220 [Henckelia pumila]|uniref:putative F-box/FBD/LRR-repeat protein At4g03220 n=1 Tax=Henckelia pumila TaxID=405737 RepID=UPI003C6E2961